MCTNVNFLILITVLGAYTREDHAGVQR
jgi:hypothetical protein